ncbi:MAG: GNAT family N-acetyltransferase [Myxococcota bacterium]
MSGSSTPPSEIRPARPDEAERLSRLAWRSKAHWRYDEAQMAVFRRELTLTPDALGEVDAYVIDLDGEPAAFYTLRPVEQGVELEHLFVEPHALRRGLGRRLWEHAVERAREAGHRAIWIQSDPNAEGFYRAVGARKERDVPTSIPGRTLPLMRRIL